jgi:hypothetical protein
MNINENGKKPAGDIPIRTTLDDLNLGEVDHPGEDRICIVRNHATGDLSWRFACPRADPIGMLFRALFHQLMAESGWRERIEKLEAECSTKDGDPLSGPE